jgi:hypothetical protein
VEVLELQRLALTAVRARHEIPSLVARIVFSLNPRQALCLRRRDQQDLAPLKGRGSALGEQDRIAFALDIAGIPVDLVEEQVPRRHRTQADRAIGAGEDQHPTLELLAEHSIAAVARTALLDPLAQDLALLDQRIDALLGVALGELHRRRHRHHRARRLVDHIPNPTVAALGAADLRALH